MDIRTYYQNFNLGTELDIAGEFIYNGLSTMYAVDYYNDYAPLFTSLYNISVGIERLQKVVYGLWGLHSNISNSEFENSIRNHSHTGLHSDIKKVIEDDLLKDKLDFSPRENEFLLLLQEFYNSLRYERFNIINNKGNEKKLLREFLNKYSEISEGLSGAVENNDKTKRMIGRTVGKIAKVYYSLIVTRAHQLNIYTYELRANSKAESIFLDSSDSKDYLSYRNSMKTLAFKELLVYIRNSKEKNSFFEFLDSIEPLELEPSLINGYIYDFLNGSTSQELVDYVEECYGEIDNKKERKELVNLVGTPYVEFDFPYICEIREIVNETIKENKILDLEKINDKLKIIDDDMLKDDIMEILSDYEKCIQESKMEKAEKCLHQILDMIPEFAGIDE